VQILSKGEGPWWIEKERKSIEIKEIVTLQEKVWILQPTTYGEEVGSLIGRVAGNRCIEK